MNLHELLLALRDATKRDEACRAFDRSYREPVRQMVDRHTDLDASSRDAIFDHVRDRIVANERFGYRGEHGDGSAWAWIRTIVEHRANDARRRAQRMQRHQQESEARAKEDRVREAQEQEDRRLAKGAYEAIQRLLDEQPRQDGVASEWNELVELAFTARWNPQKTHCELVERGMIDPDERDPELIQRARNRLYKNRRPRTWTASPRRTVGDPRPDRPLRNRRR